MICPIAPLRLCLNNPNPQLTRLPLILHFLLHKFIYFNVGNIEDWLCDLLKKMQLTMKDLARNCSNDVVSVCVCVCEGVIVRGIDM